MEKLLIGVGATVLGLVLGAFAIGPMLQDDSGTSGKDGDDGRAVATVGTGVTKADLDKASELKRDADEKIKQFQTERDRALKSAEEERALTKQREVDFVKVRQERDKFEQELAELRRSQGELTAAMAEMETKRIEAARVRGREIKDSIKSMLEAGEGKEKVLGSLRDLAKIGVDAAPEYWEAFLAVTAKGSAFTPGKNELGLTFVESTGLLPQVFVDHALGAGLKEAPTEVVTWAMYSLPWNPAKTTGEKVAILGEILDNGSRELAGAAVQNLQQLQDPAAGPYLARAAVNGAQTPEVRASAVTTMAAMGDKADWNTIEQLANDPDPKVSEAARTATAGRNPQATGWLVTAMDEEKAAYKAGMRIGDIITRYNGQAVTDQATLLQARNAAGENLEVVVVVQRGASSLSFTLKTGEMGVLGGRAVEKK